MRSLLLLLASLTALAAAFAPTSVHLSARTSTSSSSKLFFFGSSKNVPAAEDRTYPEAKQATYELMKGELGFGPESIVRPLLKQTQLEKRKLKVVYNAKRDGFNAQAFHSKVDGKGASVVLAKVRGQWIGGYNPRGWASLGGGRSSVAAFLFYGKLFGGWQKLRVSRTGSMACGNDEYNKGIYFGADGLVIPLDSRRPKLVTSRLGYFFECGPENRSTLLPVKGADANVDELYVVSGVYADSEDIPNSGGVAELGFY
uniref:TLDc domain-containing protein n=1 Tax=Skeletonema marinoi TaxID=267567 RepID=A0A7S2VII2_9STRA